MKRPSFPRAISTRVMLVFAVVVLLLASAMLAINAWSQRRLEDEVSRALLSQNQYFLHVLGRDLQQIGQRQEEIAAGEPLKRLIYLPTFLSAREIQYNMQWLQREMAVLRDISPLVEDVRIYVQDESNPIFRTYPSLFTLDMELSSRYAVMEGKSRAQHVLDGAFHFLVAYPEGRALQWTDYLLDITLSNEAIQSTLDQLYMGQDGLVLLADTSMQWYVGNSSFLQAGLLPQADWMEGGTPRSVQLQGAIYLLFQERFAANGLTLFALYPEHGMTQSLTVYRLWYWLTIGLAVGVLMLLGMYLNQQIHKPLRALMQAFANAGRGDLDVRLHTHSQDEFAGLYSSFNTTIAQLKRSIDETYTYQLYAREAKLKQLQSQINPHFLYNCFFVLYNMALVEDTDSIMHLSQYLGQYYQYVFRAESQTATVAEDYGQAMRYLHIQVLRFGNRFNLHCDEMPDAYAEVPMPRLVFQPLIENIFVHGFREKTGGDIRIIFTTRDDALEVTIEDNGVGMSPDALEELQRMLARGDKKDGASGLENVNRRLVLFYGPQSAIQLTAKAQGGLCVRFFVPKAREDGPEVA